MSPPHNSAAGPWTTDRPLAEIPGEISLKTTTTRPQSAMTTPVVAPCWPVLGGSGRVRHVIVYRCASASCGASHVAHVRGDVPARVERKQPCGGGTVVLLPVLKGSPLAVSA